MSARARVLTLAVGLMASTAAFASSPMPGASQAPGTSTASEDIRDIRGPIPIPPWWRWLAIGASAWVVAVAAVVTVRALRKVAARPLEPHELALKRLDDAQPLIDEGRARAYALIASDAVREYIEARFGLRAAHATTEEFFVDLVSHDSGPLGPHRQSLGEFLEACDLAKFARLELSPGGLASMNDLARDFVLATVPSKEDARPTQARTS